MAVEFSRRPLLSLLLSLWLSIFNLNCSCNWLEGQQGGTLLVGCAMPHGSQCAGSPLPLKKHFCCNADISPCIRLFIFLQFSLLFLIMTAYTRGDLKKAFWEIISMVVMHNTMVLLFNDVVPFIGYFASERGPDHLNTMPLRIADISNYQGSIHITGSLMHVEVTHYYSVVKVWLTERGTLSWSERKYWL